jgi:hypothetical protein
MLRVIFNNGIVPATPPCTAEDNYQLDWAFTNPYVLGLNVRRRASISNETTGRELVTYPGKCKDACLGVMYCRVTSCLGYDGTIKRNRNLQSKCDYVMSDIDRKLDKIVLSSSCFDFIGVWKREILCFDDTVLGNITGAKLWITSGSVQTARNLTSSGLTVCKSQNITFEGLANSCVNTLGFQLKGPNGYSINRTATAAPYGMFGYDGVSKFYGQPLPSVGLYNLTIRPDNYTNKDKTFSFTATNC